MTKSQASDKEQARTVGASVPQTNPALPTGRLKQVTMTQTNVDDDEVHSRTERPPAETANDPYIGATIDGRYCVEAQLGEGGMGVVYRCRHTIIDKKVAMKVLRADMARNEEVTERFLNEARSASSIGNPHIIDISDFGRLPDGATYFIMEFLTGTPLADLTHQGKALTPDRAGHICVQLAEGLAAAHEAGIVHRDLKPDNIFLVTRGSEEDFVKILDFGIAKASTNSSKLTQAGQVFGTPHYMSPEQAAGSEVDRRSDIYALGVILYELSTGRLPFDADNFMAILTQHMYKEPLRPSDMEGLPYTLPEGLEEVILKCMAKEPAKRYQTMAELEQELRRVFSGMLPVSARERRSMTDTYGSPRDVYESRPTAIKKPNTRVVFYAGIGIVAALAVALFAWTSQGDKSTDEQAVIAAAAPSPHALEKEPSPAAEQTAQPATRRVAIAVAPLSARVFSGDEDLGQSPVMIEVGDEPISLSVRLDGYVTRELSIDGSQEKVSVELEKIEAPKSSPRPVTPTPRSASQPKPKPIGGGELVDPWD